MTLWIKPFNFHLRLFQTMRLADHSFTWNRFNFPRPPYLHKRLKIWAIRELLILLRSTYRNCSYKRLRLTNDKHAKSRQWASPMTVRIRERNLSDPFEFIGASRRHNFSFNRDPSNWGRTGQNPNKRKFNFRRSNKTAFGDEQFCLVDLKRNASILGTGDFHYDFSRWTENKLLE